MRAVTMIFASAITGYLITDTLYIAAAYGGVAICVLAVYSLWREEQELLKEQARWRRLTEIEREDRLRMLAMMEKLENAKRDLGVDYVLDPHYKAQERHRLMVEEMT